MVRYKQEWPLKANWLQWVTDIVFGDLYKRNKAAKLSARVTIPFRTCNTLWDWIYLLNIHLIETYCIHTRCPSWYQACDTELLVSGMWHWARMSSYLHGVYNLKIGISHKETIMYVRKWSVLFKLEQVKRSWGVPCGGGWWWNDIWIWSMWGESSRSQGESHFRSRKMGKKSKDSLGRTG